MYLHQLCSLEWRLHSAAAKSNEDHVTWRHTMVWRHIEAGVRGCRVTRLPPPLHYWALLVTRLISLCLYLWIQVFFNSLLVFRYDLSFLIPIIATFSLRHRSQFLLPGWYGERLCRMVYLTLGSGWRPLSHTYLERVEADFLLKSLKDCMCPPYLVLKSPSVSPM